MRRRWLIWRNWIRLWQKVEQYGLAGRLFLWENGRERHLITLLNKGEGQGYAAWRVLPAPDAWQEIVQMGLRKKVIDF